MLPNKSTELPGVQRDKDTQHNEYLDWRVQNKRAETFLTQEAKNNGYSGQSNGRSLTFWENPQRIARYYDYSQRQPQNIQYPSWFDRDAVKTIYDYMSFRNGYKPWTEWEPLPETDTFTEALRGLPQPQDPSLLELEDELEPITTSGYSNAQNPTMQALSNGSYLNLSLGEKLGYGMFGVGLGQANNQTKANRNLGVVGQAALAGFGYGAATTWLTKNPAVGIAVGMVIGTVELTRAIATQPDSKVNKTLAQMKNGDFTAITEHAHTSGQSGAVIANYYLTHPLTAEDKARWIQIYQDKADGKMGGYDAVMGLLSKAFNFASQTTEQTVGIIYQATSGDKDFKEVFDNFGAAVQAATYTYESLGKTANPYLQAVNILDGNGFLKKGEYYDITHGLSGPQEKPEGFTTGATALDQLRDQIAYDPTNIQEYKNQFIQKFGVEGQINDFVFQSLLDPSNLAPYVGAKSSELLGKVTGDAALQEAGKMSAGNPIVDALPFGVQQATEWTAKTINPATTFRGSRGVTGVVDLYKIWSQDRVTPSGHIIDITKYSPLQRKIANLNMDGNIRTMQPEAFEHKGFDPRTWAKWWQSESNEFRAINYTENFLDNLRRIFDASNGDEVVFEKMVRAVSQADTKLTVEAVNQILKNTGVDLPENWINSPAISSVADGFKHIVESGTIAQLFDMYKQTGENRVALSNFAKFFGVSEAEIVKRLRNNFDFDTAYKAIMADSNIDPARKTLIQEFDPLMMKLDLAPYLDTKNPVPYDTRQMTTYISNQIADQMSDFIVQRFGIKADPYLERLGTTLKKATSLVLLGFNPRYLVYNETNNILTRAVYGAGGWFNTKKFFDKFETDPYGTGGNLSEDIFQQGSALRGIRDRNKGAKGQKTFDFINNIFDGISRNKWMKRFSATGLSGKLENFESAQARISAYTEYFYQAWKPQLSKQLDNLLSPELKRVILGAAGEAGNTKHLDAIMDSISTQRVFTRQLLYDTAVKFYKAQGNKKWTPEIIESVLTKSGLMDDLSLQLSKAKTIDDVRNAFSTLEKQQINYVNDIMKDAIDARMEDVRNRVESEGIGVALDELSDMQNFDSLDEFARWMDWDSIWRLADSVDKTTKNALFNDQRAKNQNRFDIKNDWQRKTYEGIFEAAKAKSTDVDAFLGSFDSIIKLRKSYFDAIAKLQDSFFSQQHKPETYDADHKQLDLAMELEYKAMLSAEETLQAKADAAVIRMAGNTPEAIKWRTDAFEAHKKIVEAMHEFRQSLGGMTTQQKNSAYFDFITNKFIPLREALKQINFEGMQNILPGQNAAGKTAIPSYDGMAQLESAAMFIDPLLRSMRDQAITDINNPVPLEGFSPAIVKEINRWKNQMSNDLRQTKFMAQKYANVVREHAMLDYSKKSNGNNSSNFIFPYHFWFTETMRNWAIRCLDKPGIAAMYLRYRQIQQQMEANGIPTRLQGKIMLPAPYLESWMGDTIWVDPMAQVFPLTQLLQPIKNILTQEESVKYDAIDIIKLWKENGDISEKEATEALENMTGQVWEDAYAQAYKQSDLSDPFSLASMMMSPAMWVDIPIKMLTGKRDEIARTPLGKTSESMAYAAKELIPGRTGEAIGNIVGIPSWLETNIRKAVGMSPAVARYGQWGDYYIESEMRNMAFDGTFSKDEVIRAMIEHKGAAYDMADQRVSARLNLKQPGGLTVEAVKNGANFGQISSSFFLSMFPNGILPSGELKYKGLQQEYNQAWQDYKTGDKRALTEFYNDHPEYETRSALAESDPEVRFKEYIIGSIWDRYMNSGEANKRVFTDMLGPEFESDFIDTESGDPESIPLEKLVQWARQMSIIVPETEFAKTVEETPPVVELWGEDATKAYEEFTRERESKFPMWYELQEGYFSLAEDDQPEYLESNPDLQRYWDWKEDFASKNPEVVPVFESRKSPYISQTKVSLANFDSALVGELQDYYSTGKQMTTGAWSLLYQEWEDADKPYDSFDTWLKKDIKPAIVGYESNKGGK